MSLIVDINPVPWEILEQVKARLLKNRATKQKRQPEKGKDLRRVMQVDNGILAKQRWEEPSFILSGDTPYIAIVTGGQYGTKYVSGASYTTYQFGPLTGLTFVTGLTYTQIGNVTVKLNGTAIGNIQNPGIDNFVVYLFVWSNGIDVQEQAKAGIGYFYANSYSFQESTQIPTLFNYGWDYTYEPSPNIPYLIKLNWKVILVDSGIFPEPQRGDKIKLDLIPESSIKPLSSSPSNARIWSALAEDEKSIASVTSATFLPRFSTSVETCQSFTLEFPVALGEQVKFTRLQ